MITISQKGDFEALTKYLKKTSTVLNNVNLDKYGKEGVALLSMNTPKQTGATASSWNYKVVKNNKELSLQFYNTNVVNGSNIAILLQYGHGTRNGGYVQGIDYINPSVKPLFEKLANDVWREVTKL